MICVCITCTKTKSQVTGFDVVKKPTLIICEPKPKIFNQAVNLS